MTSMICFGLKDFLKEETNENVTNNPVKNDHVKKNLHKHKLENMFTTALSWTHELEFFY